MDKGKKNRVSEEERIKQRNLNWPARRRVIGRVLFVALTILAIIILAFALWVHLVEQSETRGCCKAFAAVSSSFPGHMMAYTSCQRFDKNGQQVNSYSYTQRLSLCACIVCRMFFICSKAKIRCVSCHTNLAPYCVRGAYKYMRCNSLGWRFVIRSRTFCNHFLVISPFAACCISLTQLGLSRASFIVFLDC